MIHLKPHRQTEGYCGPSSLKMVLGHYGIRKTESELAELCGSDRDNGTHAHRMVAVARKFGLQGSVEDVASLADLRKWVSERGVPVIVDWFSVDEGHYSPVVSVTEKTVTLMDPERGGMHRIPVGTFLNVWFDFEPGGLPSRNKLILRRLIVIHD